LPPPPPLTAEVFFAQFLGSQRNAEQSQKNMEDFLCTIANNVQRGNNQGGGNGVNQYNNFKDFMDTRPPIFKEATEPLDVEEWINTMKDKFRVLRLTEVLKTEYVHISYKDQQGCGGSIIVPPSLQMLRSRGESSLRPFVEFIFYQVWLR
jgi:hypothetical protein